MSKKVNVISENREFILQEGYFKTFENQFPDPTKYKIVGIVGPQNKGKSTLLNIVFGTTFDVLGENQFPQRTTLGAQLDVKQDVVILDVEGMDSHERRQEDEVNEIFNLTLKEFRKQDCFVCSLSFRRSNSKYFCIGCRSKHWIWTELNEDYFLGQFQDLLQEERKKKVLIIVLRDVDNPNEAFISAMKTKIKENLKNCWKNITKTEIYQDCELEDFFSLKFEDFPNFRNQSLQQEFISKAKEFREIFINEKCDRYVFKDHQISKSDEPLEILPSKMKEYWSTINDQEELNIPKQQELIQNYRFKVISEETLEKIFFPKYQKLTEIIRNQIYPSLGEECNSLFQNVTKEFLSLSKWYSSKLKEEWKKKLEGQILPKLEKLLEVQAEYIEEEFKKQFQKKLPSNFQTDQDSFTQTILDLTQLCEQYVEYLKPLQLEGAKPEKVLVVLQRGYDLTRKGLDDSFELFLSEYYNNNLKNDAEKVILNFLDEENNSLDFWNHFNNSFVSLWSTNLDKIKSIFSDPSLQKDRLSPIFEKLEVKMIPSKLKIDENSVINHLQKESVDHITKFLKDYQKNLPTLISNKFKNLFSMDNGAPRQWAAYPGNIRNLNENILSACKRLIRSLRKVDLHFEGPSQEEVKIDHKGEIIKAIILQQTNYRELLNEQECGTIEKKVAECAKVELERALQDEKYHNNITNWFKKKIAKITFQEKDY